MISLHSDDQCLLIEDWEQLMIFIPHNFEYILSTKHYSFSRDVRTYKLLLLVVSAATLLSKIIMRALESSLNIFVSSRTWKYYVFFNVSKVSMMDTEIPYA